MKRNEKLNKFIASFALGSFIFCGYHVISDTISKRNKNEEDTVLTCEEIVDVDNNIDLILDDTYLDEVEEDNTKEVTEEVFEEQIESEVIEESLDDNNKIIGKYGYLLNDMMLYDNLDNMNEIAYIDKYQKVVILSFSEEYSLISYIDDNCVSYTGYVYTSGLDVLPNTFIEIDIELQEIRLFIDNNLEISSSVITGKDESPTSLGYYYIDWMESPSVLRRYYSDGTLEYEIPVTYWMAFNGGIGIHDASWRSDSEFENKYLYHDGGSHGCVNTPYDVVEYIYNKVNEGTKVLVHK